MAFLGRIKKLASETAIYGVSTIVGRLINFLLVPLYVGFFDPDLYGVVVLVYTSFLILNTLYQHGMESAYLKYASGEEGRARSSRVFSTATWSLMIVAMALSLVVLLLGDTLSQVIGIGLSWSHLWWYAIAILSLDALAIVPFAELRLQNRPMYFAAIKLSNIAINVGLNIWLIVGLRQGIESIFIANLVASASTFVLVLPLYARLFRFNYDRSVWRQLIVFGLPFIPSGLSYAFVDRVNVILLGAMDNARVIALYGDELPLDTMGDVLLGKYIAGIFGAVWKLGVFMMLASQMFRFAWQPFFLQHAKDTDAPALFSRVFTLFTAGGVLVVLAVSFLIDDLVAFPLPGGRTLIRDIYWFGLPLVPVALLGYFFQGWYYNFTAGVYIQKKTNYFMTCTLTGAAVALVGNIVFIPLYGMWAAAWATAIAYAVMALMLLVMVQRIYWIPYNWFAVAKILVSGTLLFVIWYAGGGADWTWYAEIGLLLVFLIVLLVLRVVPINHVRNMIKR